MGTHNVKKISSLLTAKMDKPRPWRKGSPKLNSQGRAPPALSHFLSLPASSNGAQAGARTLGQTPAQSMWVLWIRLGLKVEFSHGTLLIERVLHRPELFYSLPVTLYINRTTSVGI